MIKVKVKSKTHTLIYTDASIFPNPNGPAGVGVVIIRHGQEPFEHKRHLGTGHTTNTAEMNAIKDALYMTDETEKIIIYTDSAYCQRMLMNKHYIARKNTELIEGMRNLIEDRDVEVIHVRGHKGVRYNELADKLAGEARKKIL